MRKICCQLQSYSKFGRYSLRSGIFFQIDVKDKEGSGYKVKGVKKYKFKQSHPGYKFSHLTELKHHTIPRISLPKEKLCPMEEHELHLTNPTEGLQDNCETYAKMVLLMLYPF
jgi:hypothetical protein